MARRDDGAFGYRGVLHALYEALQELAAGGCLRPEEILRMAIPTVGRSRAEFTVPFAAQGSFAGLRLERREIFKGEDHIWAQFLRDGDALRFGAS